MTNTDMIARLLDLIKRMTEHEREILLSTLKRKHFMESAVRCGCAVQASLP